MAHINVAKIQILHKQIFPLHTQHEANMIIKLAEWKMFGALFFAPKEKQWTTFSSDDVLVKVEL